MICPNCGYKNRRGVKFCENCGDLSGVIESRSAGIKCPKCKYENRARVSFCENCGNSLLQEAAQKSKRVEKQARSKSVPCPNCQFENRLGVAFCENCGFALKEGVAAKQRTATQVCRECGHKNRSDVIFCENCGASLGVEARPRVGRPMRWAYLFAMLAIGGVAFAAYSLGMFRVPAAFTGSSNVPPSSSGQGSEISAQKQSPASSDMFPIQSAPETETRPPDLDPRSPAQMFSQFTNDSLIYRDLDMGSNTPAIYESGGFRYIYMQNTWFAFDSRFSSSEVLFVLSQLVGEFQQEGGYYKFYSNGEDPAWAESYFTGKHGVSKDGAAWVLDEGQELQAWLLEQTDEDALWTQDGDRFVLLRTSDGANLGVIGTAKNALLLNPGWKWTAIRAVAFAGGAVGGFIAGGPIAAYAGGIGAVYVASVAEKAVENDWSGGCGDTKWALIVPDSDPLTGLLSGGVIDNFDQACENHDACYEDYDKTKEECDNAFYQDLLDSCWEKTCTEIIAPYYAGKVRQKGDSYYDYKHRSTGINGAFGIDPKEIEVGECTTITWAVGKLDSNESVDVWLTGDVLQISGLGDSFSSSRSVGEKGSLELCPPTEGQFTVTLVVESRTMDVNIPYDFTVLARARTPQVTVSQDTLCRKGPGIGWSVVGDLQIGEVSEVVGLYDADYIVIENYGASGTCWLYTGYAQITGDTSGLPYWETPEWEEWGEGTEEFELMLWNSSSSEVCDFYIASSSDNSWSSDLLPMSIGPGESYLFQIVDGHGSPYEIEIITCDGFTFGDSGLDLGPYNDYEFFD